MKTDYPLTHITWVDSWGQIGWQSVGEYQVIETAHCVSIGWLIADEPGYVSLAQSMQGSMVNGSITIPKGAIVDQYEIVVDAEEGLG